MKLLLVHNGEEAARQICSVLEEDQYQAVPGEQTGLVLSLLAQGRYDALLQTLPPYSGVPELLLRLRNSGNQISVMVLYAESTPQERAAALDAGADDVISGSIDGTELLARIRAMLRHSDTYQPEVLRFGNVSLSLDTNELMTTQASVRLNRKECQLMACFLGSPSRILSTGELMERIWGSDARADIHVVWTNITYLRRKLEALGANVVIRSLRGSGYVLEIRGE